MLLQSRLIYLLIIVLLFNNAYSKDIIATQSGGKAVHWTSEKLPHATINVINGVKEGYWSSSGDIFPHVLTFALPNNKRFEAISFTAKNINDRGSWAHHIRISSADPFPHMGGWEVIGFMNKIQAMRLTKERFQTSDRVAGILKEYREYSESLN